MKTAVGVEVLVAVFVQTGVQEEVAVFTWVKVLVLVNVGVGVLTWVNVRV